MNRRLTLILVIALLVIGGSIFAIAQAQNARATEYSADVVVALSSNNTEGYARATTPREFVFPQDHGAHPDFQTEWWYYTGNLADESGRRFGFQLAIFRRAIAPTVTTRDSDWGTNQVYFADFAVSNIADNQFFSGERFSRGAAGLSGAVLDPMWRVWIEDWAVGALTPDATQMNVKAATATYGIDLNLKQIKPVTLQGDRGLSAKSPEAGNASYYYSLTRMPTEGKITVNGQTFTVTGNSWMDHEYSTSVLSKDAVGWDWFAIQLDSGRDIMLYQIRKQDGTIEITSDGTIIESDGSITHLTRDQYKISPRQTWTSPTTGTIYPSGWDVEIKAPTGVITLAVNPLIANQELNSVTAYWEGASKISGTDAGKPVAGYGYVELTGYNTQTKREEPLTRQGK